jgi:hypothetical protein
MAVSFEWQNECNAFFQYVNMTQWFFFPEVAGVRVNSLTLVLMAGGRILMARPRS